MATVTVPSIKTGDEITSTTLNTFIDSVNALSGNISADNMDAEAVDRRNLRLNIPRVAHNQTNTNFTFHGHPNSRTPAIVSELGPLTHSVGEKIHVCASFQFFQRTAANLAGSYHSYDPTEFSFRLIRKQVGVPAIGWSQLGEAVTFASGAKTNVSYLPMSRSITLEFMDTISSGTLANTQQFKYALEGIVFNTSDVVTCVVDSHCFFVVRYPE